MKTVKEQLFNFLRENPGFHHGGQLQRGNFITRKGGLATGDNIKRRLNELVEEGLAMVEYKNNQASFAIKAEHKKLRQVATFLEDGSVRVSYLPV